MHALPSPLLEHPVTRTLPGLILAATVALALAHAAPAHAQQASASANETGFDIPVGKDRLHVELTAVDTVHLQLRGSGVASTSSVVVDPAPAARPAPAVTLHRDGGSVTGLDSSALRVRWNAGSRELVIADAGDRVLLRQTDLEALPQGRFSFVHGAGQPMYGIGGPATALKQDISGGLLRQGEVRATAGEQGHAGAPFVWSTAGYGVLLDCVGADFRLGESRIDATVAGKAPDYYVFVGDPHAIFASLAHVSGTGPLFPKWSTGFTNSQWGIDQKELLAIVDTYRAKHIPIDNITLDFDWKAWGEDWGEFRWNATKFPDGPDGKLKQMLAARGIHLTGIMKPRVHLDTVEGRDAAARGFFIKGEPAKDDYFSHKPVRDIDFNQPAARAWFFNDALKRSFATGIDGWWNDEADTTGDDTQHLNMQRALYDGQRGISNQRVWSINRNFYLGAQRYAYGLWSGDIATGFPSMAAQRTRMLDAIDVGAMPWGMDGGGFREGTPTPENYARWIQFGAFTPIFRVHGDFGQKRQPWVYGPVSEKAATDAIRLRYALIPYIYSYEYARHATGVGLVRPLLFDWPHDPNVRNDVDAWLFGDWLLVSPVVESGQTAKDIYLPAGRWTDWFSGKTYQGGQTIRLAVDAKRWSDIPLFVRDGAIIPIGPVEDYIGQHPLTQLDVEVFPAAQRSIFDYYDDDGVTYDYEHGKDFRQSLAVQRRGNKVQIDLGEAVGRFAPALRFYLLKIHGVAATKVSGTLKAYDSLDALQHGDGEGWASGRDRFGEVTWVRVAASRATKITLDMP